VPYKEDYHGHPGRLQYLPSIKSVTPAINVVTEAVCSAHIALMWQFSNNVHAVCCSSAAHIAPLLTKQFGAAPIRSSVSECPRLDKPPCQRLGV
jgi:hypothetical protein